MQVHQCHFLMVIFQGLQLGVGEPSIGTGQSAHLRRRALAGSDARRAVVVVGDLRAERHRRQGRVVRRDRAGVHRARNDVADLVAWRQNGQAGQVSGGDKMDVPRLNVGGSGQWGAPPQHGSSAHA